MQFDGHKRTKYARPLPFFTCANTPLQRTVALCKANLAWRPAMRQGQPPACHLLRPPYFSHSLRLILLSKMRKRFSPGTLHTKPSSAPPVTGLAPTANTSSSPSTHRGLL